jgi:ribosome-binding protein aMBF1 (putative translation factor)
VSRSHIFINRQPRKPFPTTLKTFGDRLQVARFESGFLLSELAQKLQIPTILLKRWEQNLETPTKEQWAKIADLLNLTGTAKSSPACPE